MTTEGFFFGPARCALSPVATLVLLLTMVSPALAQTLDDSSPEPSGNLEMATPDPARGHEQVKKLCVGCHSVEASAGPIQTDIPSFTSIAKRPDQTREKLLNWLTSPHPPMPDIGLSRQEIRDIGAYLMSLRKEGAR